MKKYNLPVIYDDLDWKKGEKRAVREQYITEQKGLCFWCGKDLKGKPSIEVQRAEINWDLFPKGFRNNPIHLQHDHSTGLTEGAVHMKCNAAMWEFEGR